MKPFSNYIPFIQDNFKIIDKNGEEVPFIANPVQARYAEESTGKDIILKARQQGFSSLILAIFTTDFLYKENSRSVVVADVDENAEELLDRVKQYIRSYEEINKTKVPLKYNSKSELYNEANHSRYSIGTAKSTEFGRSKTITNLHLSEAAFYPNLSKILKGAGNAVVPNGRTILETTANGYNELKTLWDECELGNKAYKPLFYAASDFYSEEELDNKRREALTMSDYLQEFPETPSDAFQTSGRCYFDLEALRQLLNRTRKPLTV
jgi:hypothetical protein